MKVRKTLFLTLVVTLTAWAWFSWPLPRHVFTGIASSSKNRETHNVRAMIPGDHLQLMYYLWVMGDMMIGRTPLFHNLYEFNTGDDSQTFRIHHGYLPFSLVYRLLAAVSTRAFAWNVTGFLSLWFTYYFAFLLTRRYARDDLIAGVAALVALLMPFRWIQLTGGSPTGFGLMWVPALFLGLDLAVRESRLAGGFLAGAALLLTRFCDSHILYFSFWSTPCWCVFALLFREGFGWRRLRDYLGIARALLPVPFFAVGALLFSVLTRLRISESTMAAGRGLREVKLYTPVWEGLLSLKDLPSISNYMYVGFVVPAILLAGLLVLGVRAARRRPGALRALAMLGLVVLAMAVVILFALGLNDPWHGRLYFLARKVLPQYSMIRQTGKVFAVAGSLLSVGVGLGLSALLGPMKRLRLRAALALLTGALIAGEYRLCIRTTVCLLDKEQGAYRAVAEDAAARREVPRLLVLPLWPGDAAWSSVYQYYVSLYRIRMVNGYHPIVNQTYFDEIFTRFTSANKGDLSDGQIDDLLARGIRYVILHEDLFPEKVSPFPVGFTLQRLLSHPRLELLDRAGPVWAFRIRESARADAVTIRLCDFLFPARHWEPEDQEHTGRVGRDAAASGNESVALDQPGAGFTTRSTSVSPAPDLRWLVRVRGTGALDAALIESGKGRPIEVPPVDSADWAWIAMPFQLAQHDRVSLRLKHAAGSVEVDTLVLAAGPWDPPAPGESVEFPASCFFHSGQTDVERGTVLLRAARDPDGTAFYGPNLPFEAGRYEVGLSFASPAEAGATLGRFNIRQQAADETGWVEVIAGRPARGDFRLAANLPTRLLFAFDHAADIEIEKVMFRRIE